MKAYTVSIDIDLPRDRVLEIFEDPSTLAFWQNGFQSYQQRTGDQRQPGSTATLAYLLGKKPMELTETITRREPPESFDATYEWQGGMNTLENRFTEPAPGTTRWESTCDYRFSSAPLKVMGVLMPWMFRAQNMKYLKNFKAFAETGADVRTK